MHAILLLVLLAPSPIEARGERPTNIIKLAGILPLTMDGQLVNDVWGDPVSKLAAFVMAMRDVNQVYGAKYNVSIRYTILDSQGHYGLAAQAVSTLATNGFPNLAAMGYGSPTVHAIIGSDDNKITQAIGKAITDYNLFAVAYGSDISEFSRGSLYPNIVRVFPSTGYESAAIADFLHYQYHAHRIVVLYTTDIYGQDALNVFQWRAAYYGFNIIETIPLSPASVSTNATQGWSVTPHRTMFIPLNLPRRTTPQHMFATLPAAKLASYVNSVQALNAFIWVIFSDEVGAVQVSPPPPHPRRRHLEWHRNVL